MNITDSTPLTIKVVKKLGFINSENLYYVPGYIDDMSISVYDGKLFFYTKDELVESIMVSAVKTVGFWTSKDLENPPTTVGELKKRFFELTGVELENAKDAVNKSAAIESEAGVLLSVCKQHLGRAATKEDLKDFQRVFTSSDKDNYSLAYKGDIIGAVKKHFEGGVCRVEFIPKSEEK